MESAPQRTRDAPAGDTGRERPAVVVLRALGLGDLLTVVPALRALRRSFPRHRLVLACPASLAALVQAADLADQVIDTDLRAAGAAAPERPLDPALHGADVAVNLHGRGPQSHRLLLAAHPRRLIAFHHDEIPAPDTDGMRPRWVAAEHEVHRWCRLLSASGVPARPEELDIRVGTVPPASTRGATLLHPGAASPARRWPPERWAAVARAEVAGGRAVVLTGSPAELPLCREVAREAGLPDDRVLAGRTGLVELAASVRAAGRVVCGDTGVAHLATALGTPSVVLFGPVPPARWGPPADRPLHRALWAGRQGDPHAGSLDPGLAAIAVDDVLDALADLPAPSRPDAAHPPADPDRRRNPSCIPARTSSQALPRSPEPSSGCS